MAIISASRRTDIPTYFSEWFFNHLEAGEVYTRNNPYNLNAVSHITFSKSDIDCICFWTKNPTPMIDKLDRLKDYQYYFQFTLTGYEKDLEKNLPLKSDLISTFKSLAMRTDKRVVWRYDPIVFTKKYTAEWHLQAFENIARNLCGYVSRCVISFVDVYDFVKRNMFYEDVAYNAKKFHSRIEFCKKLVAIAEKYNIEIYSCAEAGLDFEGNGIAIKHGACIDKDLIESYIGYPLNAKKDTNQRSACLCAESVDFGKYNTCPNGCSYCYATKNPNAVRSIFGRYNPTSPILCDTLCSSDIITEKRLKTLRTEPAIEQLSLF